MDVDYDTYADGEALLGWLNATCQVRSSSPFDGNELLSELAATMQSQLAAADIEIAHFKMTLTPDTGNDLAVLNLVRTEGRAESVHRLAEELTGGELIVNLRAEGDPEQLKSVMIAGLAEVARSMSVAVAIEHSEHFRPGRPQPTHRMAAL
jgi:hypothetical protein